MKSKKEQTKEIERLLDRYDRRIASAFLLAVQKIQSNLSLKKIAERIEAGDLVGATRILDDALIAAGFVTFNNTIQDALISGATQAQRIASASRIEYAFSVTQSNTARFMETYRANLMREMTNEMKAIVSDVVFREVSAGTNPIETARRMRDAVGLTKHQEKSVQNFRRYLENLDRRALERRLRDARFDPTVARAMREGRPLNKKQIDKMVKRYRERYVKRRAENIARTESLTLLQSGQDQYWKQLEESGVVQRGQVFKEWINTKDEKTRHAHRQIPIMNKDGVPRDDVFKSPLGVIRYPGDPRASIENRINCRCSLFYRIKEEK